MAALELKSDDPVTWNNLGASHQALGNMAAAERAYVKVLEHTPRHGAALFNLGIIHQATGRKEKATEFYSRCLEVYPRNADAHNNIG